jgi:hypothetical protein
MLYQLNRDVPPRGKDGETEIGGLVTAGTYVDGRFRNWVGGKGAWVGDSHAWNATVVSGPWAGAVMYFGASALTLVQGQNDQVRYGMVEGGNAISMSRCAHCGEPASLHVLQQDGDSWGSLLALRDAIQKAQQDASYYRRAVPNAKGALKTLRRKLMLGVLITKRQQCWAAHSGTADETGIQAIVENILGWQFAGVAAVTPPLLNRRGETATDGRGPRSDLQTREYQCAAPKLIQAVIKGDDAPWAMSEAFFNEDDGAGPQASCARCIASVRYMLCPL